MKKVAKVIIITFLSLIGLTVLALAALLWWVSKTPVVAEDYVEKTERLGEIERRFGAMGAHEVEFKDFPADSLCGRFDIWLPKGEDGERFPVVIIANGTGTPASKIAPFCRHLASWGFVVAGNEDENCRTGLSSARTLDFVLKEFAERIDSARIGISGHSQGGVGAINAATRQPNARRYKAVFAASPTSPYWGQDNVFGHEWSYDAKLLTVPTFICAGTGVWDAGKAESIEPTEGQGICPLWGMRQIFGEINDSVPRVIARRTGIDHAAMLAEADGYMTAWFRLWLCDDTTANAFFGSGAELTRNGNWQNVEVRDMAN